MLKQKFTLFEKQKFDRLLDNKQEETEIEKEFYKKTEKYLKFIKWIPGVRMIGVGNSISMNSATKDSDIDLLIVTDKNRMWFVRIFITFIFTILGVRKNEKNHAGRFCLSFFCEIDGLDFSTFALKKDPYLYFWILYFKPILDFGDTYDLFIEKNYSWLSFSEYKNILKKNKSYIKYKKNIGTKRNILASKFNILNFINTILKKIFLAKTLKHYHKLGAPYGIIINDNILKFHNGDIRKDISRKF